MVEKPPSVTVVVEATRKRTVEIESNSLSFGTHEELSLHAGPFELLHGFLGSCSWER